MAYAYDNYTTNNNQSYVGKIPSNDKWEDYYNKELVDMENLNIECEDLGGLAGAVCDEYSIPWSDEAGVGEGGTLTNQDIKRSDAMTILNQSLIEAGARSNSFVEPIVNSYGVVEFREIGTYSGDIDDIYYEILTGSYTESPKGVMVTGGRPLPVFQDLIWKPIWGEEPTAIYTALDMLQNCRKQDFSMNATIVFNDPQTTSKYLDGIDNLYEINDTNPWNRIVGYSKYLNPSTYASKDTQINYTNSAIVPLQVGLEYPGTNGPNMGTLVDKPEFKTNIYSPTCWAGSEQEVNWRDGIRVPIPAELRYNSATGTRIDKFARVADVYVVGKNINKLSWSPTDDAASVDTAAAENTKLYARINEVDTTTTRLEAGKHYGVAYDNLDEVDASDKEPYIVFTKDVRAGDPLKYGKDQEYYIYGTCDYAKQIGISDTEKIVGTIFPHSSKRGILVQEIWVTIELNTPSITIFDPGVPDIDKAVALDVAQNMEYLIAAMVIDEPPPPIAYAGTSTGGAATLVDQKPATDSDITTAQDFSDTELDEYMDEMQGGGMAITWNFLDEETVVSMCDTLYGYFQSDVIETTYTCGPNCNPALGGYGERDGVVNAIRYNYTDSGAYTISVTEGPKLLGNLNQVDGGPSAKSVENQGATGTVISLAGDNIHFKLRIDGYGERWGINMTHKVIKVGDVVQCTIHNNPVEA